MILLCIKTPFGVVCLTVLKHRLTADIKASLPFITIVKLLKTINEQIKKMHKNKDNDSKMSYNGVDNPTKELKGDVASWIIAYTIQRKFSRV